jgi:beta-mannosidase
VPVLASGARRGRVLQRAGEAARGRAAADVARIEDVLVRSDLSRPSRATLVVSSAVERRQAGSLELETTVTLAGRTEARASSSILGDRCTQALPVESPRRWWPNGWGEHPLYEVTVRLRSRGRTVHRWTRRIGLRTVEVVREPGGGRFGIEVNGRPLVVRGADWTPADPWPRGLTDGDRRRLRAYVDARVNLIRAGEGGLYEADAFYDLCDENGLLVWPDFAPALGGSLGGLAGHEGVRQEVAAVVRRLRHHPSIALWCVGPIATAEPDRVVHRTLRRAARLYDPDRPWWPGEGHACA